MLESAGETPETTPVAGSIEEPAGNPTAEKVNGPPALPGLKNEEKSTA